MRYHKIPSETVRRLPVYLRGLQHLSCRGTAYISSKELASFLGFNSWMIRKDFSYFGDFGTPGVGYDIKILIKQIHRILRLNVNHGVALVGVGNLGSAMLAYPGFVMFGFQIMAAFDNAPAKIGKKKNGVLIEDTDKITSLKCRNIDLGIIAVPEEYAQDISDRLVSAGIKGILNFSPRYLTVPKKIKIVTIDIAMDLARLPYYMPAG